MTIITTCPKCGTRQEQHVEIRDGQIINCSACAYQLRMRPKRTESSQTTSRHRPLKRTHPVEIACWSVTALLVLIPAAWPVSPLFAITALSWRLVRTKQNIFVQAIARVFGPLALGLGLVTGLVIFTALLGLTGSGDHAPFLSRIENFFIEARMTMRQVSSPSLAAFVFVVALLTIISYALPDLRLVRRAAKVYGYAQKILLVLVAMSSFTFFAQWPLDRIATHAEDSLFQRHVRAVFRIDQQAARKQLLTEVRAQIAEQTASGQSNSNPFQRTFPRIKNQVPTMYCPERRSLIVQAAKWTTDSFPSGFGRGNPAPPDPKKKERSGGPTEKPGDPIDGPNRAAWRADSRRQWAERNEEVSAEEAAADREEAANGDLREAMKQVFIQFIDSVLPGYGDIASTFIDEIMDKAFDSTPADIVIANARDVAERIVSGNGLQNGEAAIAELNKPDLVASQNPEPTVVGQAIKPSPVADELIHDFDPDPPKSNFEAPSHTATTVVKRCGFCHAQVPAASMPGMTCPHCHRLWVSEVTVNSNLLNGLNRKRN